MNIMSIGELRLSQFHLSSFDGEAMTPLFENTAKFYLDLNDKTIPVEVECREVMGLIQPVAYDGIHLGEVVTRCNVRLKRPWYSFLPREKKVYPHNLYAVMPEERSISLSLGSTAIHNMNIDLSMVYHHTIDDKIVVVKPYEWKGLMLCDMFSLGNTEVIHHHRELLTMNEVVVDYVKNPACDVIGKNIQDMPPMYTHAIYQYLTEKQYV